MYKNLKQLMDEAQALDYTVGAFNAHNLEMVPPMITAAKDAGSPIIIQTSVATAEYVGMKNFVAVCKSMAEDLLVDVDLHLVQQIIWSDQRSNRRPLFVSDV